VITSWLFLVVWMYVVMSPAYYFGGVAVECFV
jgi:hypothetical protein